MTIRHGGRLSAAFACVFMLAAGSAAAAADTAPALDAMRDMAARIQAATQETLAAHAAERAIPAASAAAAKRMRGELDAICRTASVQGFASDATFARKQHQVDKLLRNLERAEAAARDATLPALVAVSDPRHTMRVALATGHGASCATALSIAPGDAVDANLAAAGQDASTLWLRVVPAKQGYTRLDTAPTALDTEITLFGTACPASEADATAHDDDSFGLAAAVSIDTAHGAGVRYARVRNLGRAGHVIARVETAGAFVGRITDERTGLPMPAVVETVTTDGFTGNSTYNDASSGLYLLTTDPGSYYVYADGQYGYSDDFLAELYPDAPCGSSFGVAGCDFADATLLTLADGQQLAGIDLALNVGGRIAGAVRDASSGAPIPDAHVFVFDANGNAVNYNNAVDAAGRFTVSGLLTGTYYVQAGAGGYGGQLFDHIACGGGVEDDCQPLSGTPLSIVRNQLTSGIDFDLPHEAHIVATASSRDGSGAPPFGWLLTIYDANGVYMNQFSSYGTVPIDAGPLAPGTYRAFATAGGFFAQIWNGIDCPADCTPLLDQGTPITLARGDEADLSFSLLPSPTVSGTITDAVSHAPLSSISVELVPTGADQIGAYAYTDNGGHYIVVGAAAGSYYLWANDNMHRPTLYPDAPCTGTYFSSCDTGSATVLTIAYGGANITGIDIAMPPDGSISGHVTAHMPPGMTLAPIVPDYDNVILSDASGNYVSSASIDATGAYTVLGLPAGTYHALASGFGFAQLYDGIDCGSSCNPSNGTPITLAQGQSIAGIDFDPMPNDYVFGQVTGAGGMPLGDVAIDLWNALDSTHCGVTVTNADGYYALDDTDYECYQAVRLSTDVDPGSYINEVYDDIACPNGSVYLGLCSLAGGTMVSFPDSPAFVIANFALVQPETIFDGSFEH